LVIPSLTRRLLAISQCEEYVEDFAQGRMRPALSALVTIDGFQEFTFILGVVAAGKILLATDTDGKAGTDHKHLGAVAEDTAGLPDETGRERTGRPDHMPPARLVQEGSHS